MAVPQLKSIEKMVGKEDLFTAKYKDSTIWDVVYKTATKQITFDSLGDISEVTSLVDGYLADALEKFGIDEEEYAALCEIPFESYKTELFDKVASYVELAPLLKDRLNNTGNLGDALCLYETIDGGVGEFTLKNLIDNAIYQDDVKETYPKDLDSFLNYAVNRIRLDSFVSTEGNLEFLAGAVVGELSAKANDITLGDFLDHTPGEPALITWLIDNKGNIPISELADAFDSIPLNAVLTYEPGDSLIIKWLIDNKGSENIMNIAEMFDEVPLNVLVDEKVLDPTDPSYNSVVAGIFNKKDADGNPYTIGNFDKAIAATTVKDVIPDADKPGNILSGVADVKLSELNGDTFKNNTLVINAFGDQIYDSEGNLDSMWKYLLVDPADPEAYKTYNMNDVGKMITNFTANMQTTSLDDLVNDGILAITDTTILDKYIGAKRVGDMNLIEFINSVNTVLDLLP